MRMRKWAVAAAMLLAGAAGAQSWRPRLADGDIGGPPSRVMVLGTPHLSGLPDGFRPADLAPLLDRLARWHPDAIAIEALSGIQCDGIRRFPTRYPGTADTYCFDPAPAAHATGLDVPAADAEMTRLLAAWPAAPSPAQRRRLAAVMLAAGEPASAMVQWLRLPAAERRAGDTLGAALVAFLEKRLSRRNEDDQIGAALAARLGHERVWPVDDHTSDDAPGLSDDDPAFGAAMKRIWSGPVLDRRMAANQAADAGATSGAGVLAMYRHYNAPDQPQIAFDSDFGRAVRDRDPGLYGRRYAGGWETRNLRMAANIRAVLAGRPGARLLAIVGASHKGYYEAYLPQMADVRVADVRPLLR